MQSAVDALGQLTFWSINAGYACIKPCRGSAESWNTILGVNLLAMSSAPKPPFRLCARPGGEYCQHCSVRAIVPAATTSSMTPPKPRWRGLTRGLALDHAVALSVVNAVCPALFSSRFRRPHRRPPAKHLDEYRGRGRCPTMLTGGHAPGSGRVCAVSASEDARSHGHLSVPSMVASQPLTSSTRKVRHRHAALVSYWRLLPGHEGATEAMLTYSPAGWRRAGMAVWRRRHSRS